MFGFLSKKTPKGDKVAFKIDGMHCTSCSLNIDGLLEDLPGVSTAETSYAQGVTKIMYQPDQISVPKLKKQIESLGYTATLLEL